MTKEMREDVEPFAKELYRAGWSHNSKEEIRDEYFLSDEEAAAIKELFDEYDNDGLRTVYTVTIAEKSTGDGEILGYYYNWYDAMHREEDSWRHLTKEEKKTTSVFISGWDLPESDKSAKEVYKEWEENEPYRDPDFYDEMRENDPV